MALMKVKALLRTDELICYQYKWFLGCFFFLQVLQAEL